MRRKLAKKLGGAPGEHERLLMALWMVSHGVAMLLIAKTILPKDAEDARVTFRETVAAMVRQGQSPV
jgi:hypothetical protein